MKFNEKLINLRKKAGLSQEELGYKLNVTRQTVSKWELGQTTPEGFASILWKDSKKAKEAAEIMKLTAADLYELGIIEKVIPEYPVINENNIKRVTLYMKRMICDFMYRYIDMDKEELARQRYNRFRKM